jgi:hypothetical protein
MTITMRDLKLGQYFKRTPDAKAVYVRGDYDRSTKKFSATDFHDCCREIFIRGDKQVFIDFEF